MVPRLTAPPVTQRFGDPIAYDPVNSTVHYGSLGPSGSSFEWTILLLVLGVVAIVAFSLSRYLRGRQEVAKARFETLAKLAERGALGSDEAKRLMPEIASKQPRSGLFWKLIIFVAWLTLLAGILCFILAGFASYRQSDDYAMAGVICCFIATAVFATPFMFRELRKQGIIQ